MRVSYKKSKNILLIQSFNKIKKRYFEKLAKYSFVENLFVKGDVYGPFLKQFPNLKNVATKNYSLPSSFFGNNQIIENINLDIFNLKQSTIKNCKNLKTVKISKANTLSKCSIVDSDIDFLDLSNVVKIESDAINNCNIKHLKINLQTKIQKNSFSNSKIDILEINKNLSLNSSELCFDYVNCIVTPFDTYQINGECEILTDIKMITNKKFILFQTGSKIFISNQNFNFMEAKVDRKFETRHLNDLYEWTYILNELNQRRIANEKSLFSFPPKQVFKHLPTELIPYYFMAQKKCNKLVSLLNNTCYIPTMLVLANALGLFNSTKTETDKSTKQREKAFDFLMTLYNSNQLFAFLNRFNSTHFLAYNEYFANFILNNKQRLLDINFNISCNIIDYAYKNSNHLTNVYKNKFGKSLQFTVDMINDSLVVKNLNFNFENKDFLYYILNYTHDLSAIKVLLDLYRQRQDIPKTKNHFNVVDKSMLSVKYRILDKDDYLNYVLGYVVDCCAKPNRVGEAIMKYSILKDDYFNVVYELPNGQVCGKSTVYSNLKSGFLFFNNVKIPHKINAPYMLKMIKNSLYKVANDLATEINKTSKHKIHHIYMGTFHNDLEFYMNRMVTTNDKIPSYNNYDLNDEHGNVYILWEETKATIKQSNSREVKNEL